MTIICALHAGQALLPAVNAAGALAQARREPLSLWGVLPGAPAEHLVHSSQLKEALTQQAARLTHQGVETETSVLHCSMERAVRQACADKAASLLVLLDAGEPSTAHWAGPLHAFTENVRVPLLVVRDARPFEAWALRPRPLRVLMAVDHTWNSSVARAWLCRLAGFGPLQLVVSMVFWAADESARRGRAEPRSQEDHAALQGLMHLELQQALGSLPAAVSWEARVERGVAHIAQELLAVATAELVDLLVLASHPLRGPLARLRSISRELLVEAPMSVACIPAQLEAVAR